MKHILVPVDFTEYSDAACQYAVQLAAQSKADRITLFHCYHVPVIDPMMPQDYLKDLADSAEKDCKTHLNELRSKMNTWAKQRGASEVDIESTYTMGFAAEEIAAIVRSAKPDLVVMGTRHGAHKKILLGSVTSSVVDSIEIPLIIVPSDCKAAAPINNVMYASNLETHDIEAVGKLLDLLSPFQTNIHFVHFKTDDDDHLKTIDEFKKAFPEDVKNKLTFQSIATGSVSEGLEEYLAENTIDLLAMLTHKRPFIIRLFESSETKNAAYSHQLPLVVFH